MKLRFFEWRSQVATIHKTIPRPQFYQRITIFFKHYPEAALNPGGFFYYHTTRKQRQLNITNTP